MNVPKITYFGRNNQQNNSIAIRPSVAARMRVQLDRAVTRQDNSGEQLRIVLEYSRFKYDGGFPVRVPVVDGYFFNDTYAKTIFIPVGQNRGVSEDIIVNSNPSQNGVPVEFPDDLMVTAYIGSIVDGDKRSHIISVDPSAAARGGESRSAGELDIQATISEFNIPNSQLNGALVSRLTSDALARAIILAKQQLGTDLVSWSLASLSGQSGGFAEIFEVTAAVNAHPGPPRSDER